MKKDDACKCTEMVCSDSACGKIIQAVIEKKKYKLLQGSACQFLERVLVLSLKPKNQDF